MDWKLVRKIARDSIRLERIDYERCDVLTLAHDNDRSLLLDGKYYSPLIDTLEDRLRMNGVSCVSIARIISTIKGPNAYANVHSPEGAFARALLTKRLKGLAVGRRQYPFSKAEERIWGTILDRTGAKKVVGIMPSRELCVAARCRGVWVADMQHGVIADSHPWYGRRFRSHEPADYLPHAFLVWDPGSAEALRWVPQGVEVMVIGSPWLSRFIRPAHDDHLVRTLLERAESAFERGGRQNVLVTLSSCDAGVREGEIPRQLESVIRETQSQFNWLLRLHPNQIKGFASHEGRLFHRYYAVALAGYAKWEEPTRQPLPIVLSHVDMHVTWSSSVCIEAAHFGIGSCLLNPRMHPDGDLSDYYRYYKRQGVIDMVEHAAPAIHEWLARNGGHVRQPENYAAYDSEYERLVSFLSHPI